MKRYLLITAIIICAAFQKSFAQTNDTIFNAIKLLNLDYYASKPVDSLLQVIPKSYNDMGLYSRLKNNKVGGMSIRYSNGITILIKPKHYIYMNPIDINHVWNIALFKKETASYIVVIHPEFQGLVGSYP